MLDSLPGHSCRKHRKNGLCLIPEKVLQPRPSFCWSLHEPTSLKLPNGLLIPPSAITGQGLSGVTSKRRELAPGKEPLYGDPCVASLPGRTRIQIWMRKGVKSGWCIVRWSATKLCTGKVVNSVAHRISLPLRMKLWCYGEAAERISMAALALW